MWEVGSSWWKWVIRDIISWLDVSQKSQVAEEALPGLVYGSPSFPQCSIAVSSHGRQMGAQQGVALWYCSLQVLALSL